MFDYRARVDQLSDDIRKMRRDNIFLIKRHHEELETLRAENRFLERQYREGEDLNNTAAQVVEEMTTHISQIEIEGKMAVAMIEAAGHAIEGREDTIRELKAEIDHMVIMHELEREEDHRNEYPS